MIRECLTGAAAMTGQVGNLYCYVKDRIKLGTFAFVRLFVKLGLDKACPQLARTLPQMGGYWMYPLCV